MNVKKIYKRMINEHKVDNTVSYISSYENVAKVFNMLLNIPNIIVEENSYIDYFKDYDSPILLTYTEDNTLWCQETYYSNGKIAKGSGTYLIDVSVIGDNKPEDFVFVDESKIITIGGESNENS